MNRAEVTKPGLTPDERAAACLNAQTIFGLDRLDTAEQRAALIRARIVDAIKAALLEDQAEYYCACHDEEHSPN